MMRSQVQGENRSKSSRVSMTRTSKTGWLQDNFHSTIGTISRRVSEVTRLNTATHLDEAELLQVSRGSFKNYVDKILVFLTTYSLSPN